MRSSMGLPSALAPARFWLPMPCQLARAIGTSHQAHIGAFEDHAIGDQPAAQQREQACAELRTLPA